MCHWEVCWVLFYLYYIPEKRFSSENRLFAYADDSTLLPVVRKPAERPAVAPSFNWDLDRIQEWCNHRCMILNPINTKALVVIVSRSMTVSPPHGDFGLSGVSIRASPNLDILGVMFDSKLTFEDYVSGVVSRISQRIGIFRLVKRIVVDTYVLLLCYFAFVLPILECCSPVRTRTIKILQVITQLCHSIEIFSAKVRRYSYKIKG